MSNALNNPLKKRQGIGASCLILLWNVRPSKFISDRYSKIYNHDELSSRIMNKREVKISTRREQLCIALKHEEFQDEELHWVKSWVRWVIEGLYALCFGGWGIKKVEISVKTYQHENPMHAINQEEINALLEYGYEADDYWQPSPEKKPSDGG